MSFSSPNQASTKLLEITPTRTAREQLTTTYDIARFKSDGRRAVDSIDQLPKRPIPKHISELTGKVNPMYERGGPCSVNCMRVTNAVELNMRGHQVVAGPHTYTVGRFYPDDEPHYTIWRTAERLDQKLSTTHFVATAWRAPDRQVRMPYAAKATTGAGGMNGQTLRDMTAHMPDGARGFAEGEWKGTRSGHIWNWVKEDGEIKWFEGQSSDGLINVDERLKKLKAGSLTMMRTDDLTPTDEVLAVISVD